MLILLHSVKGDLSITRERISLVADNKLTSTHKYVLGSQVKFTCILLESQPTIYLNVAINGTVYHVI